MIKFSIIVPVYNTAAYLNRCVSSLINQSLRDIEVILVDDGSEDESGELCDSFARADQRIRVIHKKNEGQGIARNAGLEAAGGKYVLFIDSDDYIAGNTCESLYSYMEKKRLQLCSFGYVIEDREGGEIRRPVLRERLYVGEEVKKQFILHFFGDSQEEDELRGVSACMTAFDRSVIQKNGIRFPSEREVLSEDTVFNLEFCRYVDRAAVLPAYFYHYCQNAESFSHAYRADKLAKTKYLCGILGEYARKYDISEQVKARICMVLWVNLMECVKQEVRRSDIAFGQIYRNVKSYCTDNAVQKAAGQLKPGLFGIKQRLLLYCVRFKSAPAVIFMAWLRNRKGL